MYHAALNLLREEISGLARAGVPLAPYTTFRIGGPAAILVEPRVPADVRTCLEICRELSLPLHIMGAGSNIIVPDQGVDGVVLRIAGGLKSLSYDDGTIRCGAGVSDAELAQFAAEEGIAGFEWICDIPGSLGGAAYMNAGNHMGEMSQCLVSVRWMGTDGRLHESTGAELDLSYRRSRFHSIPGIILEGTLRWDQRDSAPRIQQRMNEIRATRRARFPEETLCAGSIFRRPPGNFAGKLIEEAACGGMRAGNACVSHKHKGFIVNLGNATANDVLELIRRVQQRVLENSGVLLETEVEFFARNAFPNPRDP